ncbi:MAG: hypothetical protein RQ826_04175 [Xanthomonadales bacterium]|nr:hypothetical protein [Xanthomonadales bacterium]
MKKYLFLRISLLCTTLLLMCGSLAAGSSAQSTAEQVEGLWFYTGLITSEGTEMPLTGVFLFKDGEFVQQSIFNGSPFEEQGAMAHAGPYTPQAGWVQLVAEQTISSSPLQDPPFSFRADTEHEVTAERSGDDLTLIFGKGTSTVQTMEYVGPGEGDLYHLENGTLALVDGHFVLVHGDENGVVTGYGRFEKDGEALTLNVIRWAEADAASATNRRDIAMQATFDGRQLTLEDGRSFLVTD